MVVTEMLFVLHSRQNLRRRPSSRYFGGVSTAPSSNTVQAARRAVESQEVLMLLLKYLEACRQDGSRNNSGIPRMVRNYFAELALLIFESARVLKPGAPLVMVNDNVRYQGAHVPVDLILSDLAEQAGFTVDAIWVLPSRFDLRFHDGDTGLRHARRRCCPRR